MRPGGGTGRRAWLRAMCPVGYEGSNPSLGTNKKTDVRRFFLFAMPKLKFVKTCEKNYRGAGGT